jgi:hypothetical protein
MGGILAHEFGHFSQGAGMRLTYFTRLIDFWFMRMVYQRDKFDEILARLADSLGRFGLIFYLLMGLIWISRGVFCDRIHAAADGVRCRQL